MMRKTLLLSALLVPLASMGMAAGEEKPKDKKTSKNCWGARVWDETARRCVKPKESGFSDEQLYDAVRDLAYAGRFVDAQGVLDAMSDQDDYRVLTYRGFTTRRLGDIELANAYYRRAIKVNPNGFLARSYMGQGFAEAGDKVAAIEQLREIQARGGAGTWAEQSLIAAIETGKGYNF